MRKLRFNISLNSNRKETIHSQIPQSIEIKNYFLKKEEKVQPIQVELVIICNIWQHVHMRLNVYKTITGCHEGAVAIGAVEMCAAETSTTIDICIKSKHAF